MTDVKETIGERFVEAGVATDRFVSVNEGDKECFDHDTRYSDPQDVPGTNYGLYAAEDDPVVILDVDYHREGSEDLSEVALAALGGLPRTLKIQSPHVPDGDRGGHRIFTLAGDETPAELFSRRLGTANPIPSWGEVVSKNKYVVAPGSQLNGCGKEWCDECATDDGGRYTIKQDRPIAEVDPDDLVEALAADPELEDLETSTLSSSSKNETSDGDYPEFDEDTIVEMLEEIPGTQHYDDWIDTAFAVFDWDSGSRGKSVFENWSRSNSKWEENDSQRRIDHIWENGKPGDESKKTVTVGTLVHKAKKHGWDPSRTPTPRELVVKYSDKYDDVEEVPEDLVFEEDENQGSEKEDSADVVEPEDLPGDTSDASETGDWDEVRTLYNLAQSEDNFTKGRARKRAAKVLESETSWMYVLESERLWVYNSDTGIYGRFGEAAAAHVLVTNLGEYYSQTERREIIGQLQDRNQTHREKLNARGHDEPLLCVGDGVINLETGEKMEHSPEYRFVRGLKWDYNPDSADVDPVIDFLDDVTERKADRDTLLDHLAHGLMPGHPYRAFVVAYGPGGNGKTQVAELFRGFVGEENAAAVEIDELTDDDFATGDLPGTFINWGDDMAGDGGGTLQELSLLKKATGGSKIRANEKFEKTFDFTNEAAMFFSANEPPRIGEQKHSMQDRIYPIEMPYRFVSEPDPEDPMEKEKEPNVSGKLLDNPAAMRGLLKLAVEHAQRLIETRGKYSQPESPEERLKKYNQSADPIMRFASHVVEPSDPDYLIRKDDVYRVYQSFVDSWGERGASERGFKRQFPKSFTEEIENARSRELATADDEKDRVVCWKRLTWTETALAQMPDWMAERYQDHFQEEDVDTDSDEKTEDGGDGYDVLPITDVAEATTGYVTVSAEVVTTQRLGGDGDGLKAVIQDATGVIDVKTWDEPWPERLAAVEGDTVVIENARIYNDDYDGTRQLKPVEGITELETIQEGVGHTAKDAPENQEQLGETADDDENGDSDDKSQKELYETVIAVVRTNSNGDGMDSSTLYEKLGEKYDENRLNHAIENLKKDGRLYERDMGKLAVE